MTWKKLWHETSLHPQVIRQKTIKIQPHAKNVFLVEFLQNLDHKSKQGNRFLRSKNVSLEFRVTKIPIFRHSVLDTESSLCVMKEV
jgi:hypothetical protein